jgi:hypothetical protein
VFGISLYFRTKLGVAEYKIHEYIDDRLKDIRQDKDEPDEAVEA